MKFSRFWKSSMQPRKQKKYRFNAPLHIKRKLMSANLSAELRRKHGKRSIGLKKEDKVKVMRGNFKGHVGKVDRTDTVNCRVYVRGAEITKKDGTKAFYPLHPSKLMIVELNLNDKKRQAALARK